MRLTGSQIQTLTDMLSDGFSPEEMERIARYVLERDYDNVVCPGSTKIHAAFQIVEYAERRNLVAKLTSGAHALNPSIPKLANFFDELGASPIADELNLERVVRGSTEFNDPVAFRERLSRIETWVCRIRYPGGGGTGFLVGPDLALTNHHVMEPMLRGQVSPRDVTCSFDYKTTGNPAEVLLDGVAVGLAQEWDVHHRARSASDTRIGGGPVAPDELDYALIRLGQKIGEQKRQGIGGTRGWLTVPSAPVGVAAQMPLMIAQYPGDLRLQLALGTVLSFEANGLRIRHNAATIGGSSGSPCFDANWRLFALHQAGDPDWDPAHVPQFNQAIPIGAIVESMEAANVTPFWDKATP